VRSQKLDFLSLIRGSRKSRHHFPATVTEVSWPSLVYVIVSIILRFVDPKLQAYHVGCNEQPLRQFALSQVFVEHGSILVGHGDILLVGETLWGSVTVINDSGMVLPDIVVRLGRLVDIALALEARVRHVFLVGTPRDTLVIKQIDNARDVGRNLLEVVVVASECVSADGGNVVGHGRVCHAEVVVNTDALGCEPLQVWVAKGIVVIGVLEPDCHESIKNLLNLVSRLLAWV
jgi:hypothetical protein